MGTQYCRIGVYNKIYIALSPVRFNSTTLYNLDSL